MLRAFLACVCIVLTLACGAVEWFLLDWRLMAIDRPDIAARGPYLAALAFFPGLLGGLLLGVVLLCTFRRREIGWFAAVGIPFAAAVLVGVGGLVGVSGWARVPVRALAAPFGPAGLALAYTLLLLIGSIGAAWRRAETPFAGEEA